ncbi:MAG TPA: phosphatidylglycerophosphatase A [Bacteroidales bacterium]|nr:phosphatidylglycerophosphatase A [Bacteroidales bacterium]
MGYCPVAPGTAGSAGGLLAAILVLRFSPHPWPVLLALAAAFTFLGVIASRRLAHEWGEDPQKTVIDEVVGMWISLLWTGSGWITLGLAFGLFRFFDIVKPLGIRKTESLPGGLGVMADDIAAGILANVTLQLACHLIPALS